MSNLQKKNNDVQVFNNPDFGQVRTIGNAEKPMFCLADVCRALDLKNPSDVSTRLDQKGIVISEGVSTTTNQYGKKTEQYVNLIYVNEPNLYRCVFQSRKENALMFQDWIFNEVLPSIRKTGSYGKSAQSDDEIIAIGYAKALEKINKQRLQILKLKCKLSEFKRNSEEYSDKKKKLLIEDLRSKSKSVLDFFDERKIVASEGSEIPFSEIWDLYYSWCVGNRIGIVSVRTFGMLLKSVGFKYKRRSSGMFYSVMFSK